MYKWEGFYSASHVSRLTGVPLSTLYIWKKQGIIRPSVRIINAEGKVEDGYTYADLAMIKLLRALRLKQLNLKSIVRTLRHLFERFGLPNSDGWSNVHVYVIGKHVYAQKPDNWDTTVATKYGQKGEMRVLGEVFEEEGAYLVPKSFGSYVEINPYIMGGEPIVKDTRVPTAMLSMLFKEGILIDKLVDLYYPIPASSIEKAIAFEKSLDEASVTKIRASVN